MYSQSFYISENVWNNAFSYNIREKKQIFVPSLKKISSLCDIELWTEVAFSDIDFDWNLREYCGLKNFYELDWNNKKIFLFDNHNHAYFFWHYAKKIWLIWEKSTLYHIDEHADTRTPEKFLSLPELADEEAIFHYTNYTLNVGNYILPAEKDGLVSEIFQIRDEFSLREYQKWNMKNNFENIILNLDLDFFEPNLDYINFSLKKDVILDIFHQANFITIATSPYFIEQKLALWVFHDIFWEFF